MLSILQKIDNFLNGFTMYKVVLYGLTLLTGITFMLSALGVLFYKPGELLLSVLLLLGICFSSNTVIAKLFNAPTNRESWGITALILFLILTPISSLNDAYIFILAGVLAMASKYLFAIHKKHLFNPAAAAAFIIGLLGFGNVGWWVGSDILLPYMLVIGLLVVRKIRRFHLFFSFLLTSVLTIACVGIFMQHASPMQVILEAFTSWPLLFFGTIMLTEPLTTPPRKHLHILYGGLVGILFGLQFQIGPIYSTPELALILGNIFSYIVSPKRKLFLRLRKRVALSSDMYEFIFSPLSKVPYLPGQYVEWTLPHKHIDSRGNRRYFTIASSPTEPDIKLGVKIIENAASSFKKSLLTLKEGDQLVASQLTGDFTLPPEKKKKLVFIAGGIGITPFRSMIHYLLDRKEKRDIVLFYASATADGFVYKNIFERASKELGIKVCYVLTNMKNIPKDWSGKTGYITEKMIRSEVPDFEERTFYISGPNRMVQSYQTLLEKLSIGKGNIVIDYFPGF